MARYDHDHELVIGSDTYRLNLMRDTDGIPMYAVSEELVTPQDTNFDPNSMIALRFIQNDWSGGHGQGIWKDHNRYAIGSDVETSEPGCVRPGVGLGDIFVERFCLAVADDGGAFTTQTTAAANATTNDMTLLPATPAVNDAYYFGASETFTSTALKVGQNGAGTWTITWEYYNGSSWAALTVTDDEISNFKGGAGWKVNNFTLPTDWATTSVNSVSGYWVRGRVSAYTSVTTQPLGTQCRVGKSGMSLTEAPVTIYRSDVLAAASGQMLVATATKVFYHNNSSSMVTRLSESTTNPSGVLQFIDYNGVIYAARGASTAYSYSTDGDTWTATTLSDTNANGFLVCPNPAGTQDVLWKFKTPNEVKFTTDGRVGGVQWSSVNYVGDTSTNITNMMLLNDRLLVGKTNNLYYLDSDGGIHAIYDDLRNQVAPTIIQNFKYTTKWLGGLYFSLMTRLGEMTSAYEINTLGPWREYEDFQAVFATASSRECSGLAICNDSLLIMYNEGSNYTLYRGITIGGQWFWHPITSLSTNASTCMATGIAVTTSERIYLGYGNYVKLISVRPRPYRIYGGYTHSASGYVITGFWDGGYPQADKMIQSVVTRAINLSATETISVDYLKDTETSWTSMISAITTSGTVETYLTTPITFKKISFKITIASDTTDTTTVPTLEHFQVNGVLKPEVGRVHECTYMADSKTGLRGSTIRNALRTARTSTTMVKFADLTYDESTSGTNYHWVVMLPGYPQEITVVHQKGQPAEKAIKCRWLEVDYPVT